MSEREYSPAESLMPEPPDDAYLREVADAQFYDGAPTEDEIAAAQLAQDKAAGLSDENIEALDGPRQRDSRQARWERSPSADVDEEGNVVFRGPEPEAEQASTADVQQGGVDLQLFEAATAQVMPSVDAWAREQIWDGGLDGDEQVDALHQVVQRSEALHRIENPEYDTQITTAKLMGARAIAAQYQGQGLSRAQAMTRAAQDVAQHTYRVAYAAAVGGQDVATVLEQEARRAMQQYGSAQVQAPAPRGQSHAQQIQSGQKAARGLGRGGTSPGGKGSPSTEREISEIKNGPEFERAYRQWLVSQGVES